MNPSRNCKSLVAGVCLAALSMLSTAALAQAPAGETKGTGLVHTPESGRKAIDNAQIGLPGRVTSGAPYLGPLAQAPRTMSTVRAPVVVFLHGSSGLGLAAIGEWQRWLASLGIASIAPDSFAVPDRMTYKSPIAKDLYEKIHDLRASEIALALDALKNQPWADTTRLVLAGTSEGAPAVARHAGLEFAGRILFAWSCEDNYFVTGHRTALVPERPVLNVISSTDPFFSAENAWLGNPQARGHCAGAFKAHKQASVVLIPGAPHTLLNLPAARHPVEGFLKAVLGP